MTVDAEQVTITESYVAAGEWVTVERLDRFDPSKGSREIARVPVDGPPPVDERLAALEAKAAEADSLKAVLVDKGVIAEADVVAIAAPAEEVAIKG